MTVRPVKGGFRAYSHKTGKPIGPKRPTKSAAGKDVARAKRFGKAK